MKSQSRGSVLITVIWMLSLLAIFTVVVNRRASQELYAGEWMKNRILMRALAQAGIERALLEIQSDKFITFDALNETWASNEDAFKERLLGEGSFSVACPMADSENEESRYGACDESSRININTAPEEILKNLLKAVEPDKEDKEVVAIAEAIIDWRDSDSAALAQGAEANYYRALSNPYNPRNDKLQSVEELLMVRGIDEKLFKLLKPYVTIYTDGKVNFNTAPKIVLQALGLSSESAIKVVEFRRGADLKEGTKDDGIFQSTETIAGNLSAISSFSGVDFAKISDAINQNQVSVKSNTFRIHSIGRLMKDDKAIESSIICVITRLSGVLYWQEGEN